MTMADFDSLFVDNLGDFQPVLMQTQYTGRESVGRARSSGSLDRTGSGSPNNPSLTPPLPRSTSAPNKSQQSRASSLHSHRRQLSTGAQQAGSSASNDPFSEIMTEFWAEQGGSPNESPNPSEAVPPMHTDRLLSFRVHQPPNVLLLDSLSQPVNARMAAQLHGMFFLAESPWDAAGGPAPAGATVLPKELTCYRRNLFQVSGSLSIPHIQSVVLSEEGSEITLDAIATGKRRMVQSLEASISGIESVEYSPVKIITVPWKNAAAQSATQQSQPPLAPPNEDFPPMANAARALEKEPVSLLFNYPPAYYANPVGIPPEEEADSYKYPLSWKRLQFRSATANNGRRKDLQQHFLVKITIFATLFPDSLQPTSADKPEKVAICEAYSGPIIVRGRSPRNFSSRNDIPLTGSAIVSSRHNHNTSSSTPVAPSAAKKARHLSSSSAAGYDEEQKPNILQMQDQGFGLPQTQAADYLPVDAGSMMAMGLNYSPGTIWGTDSNWVDIGPTGPGGLPVQPLQSQAGMGLHQYGFDGATYPDLSDPSSRLSLTGMMQGDDFSSTSSHAQFFSHPRLTNQENSMPPPQLTQRPSVPRAPSAQSPSMDLLYEYFPIGIDDWLPPVDVVYRPHNAHHQTQPPPGKGSNRSKRLFSETPFE